ncbi:probable proteasome inhibitor [Coccomyxa sp. Obi]|nr:probable proteasome inhibitor [Coccomyxa sp. Obi]
MATPQVIVAIVRAARPHFRSKYDRLAYAIHAFLLADGYKLVATGKDADVFSTEIPADSPEVGMEGWTDLPNGEYAFRYVDTTGKRNPIMLKMTPMNNKMLLLWASPGSFNEPRMLELDVDDYVDDNIKPDDPTSAYKNLGDLASRLQSTFYVGAAKDAAAPPAEAFSTATQAGSEVSPLSTSMSAAASRSVEEDPTSELKGPPTHPTPVPYVPSIGTDDLRPPVHPPGPAVGPGGFPPGGPQPGGPVPGGLPGRRGGGMHVGPGDPLFRGPPGGLRPEGGPGMFPGFMGGPGYDADPEYPPSSLPPGAHWDPIMPPGMQGFRPEDFQRTGRGRFGRGGQPGVHPDIMPPGGGFNPDIM